MARRGKENTDYEGTQNMSDMAIDFISNESLRVDEELVRFSNGWLYLYDDAEHKTLRAAWPSHMLRGVISVDIRVTEAEVQPDPKGRLSPFGWVTRSKQRRWIRRG